ncbi:MAG: ISKra4 family transposase [Streptosporangiaceae bacterium]
MLRIGGGILGQLLAADPGCRGPRVPCGNGHEAEFISYRDKTIDTALGPVTLTRAWYHCAACKHGFAPRDAGLGVAGTSLSPGLTAMNDQAAAAGPFAKAAVLLEDLAGVRLTAKRVERAAEASGAAAAEAVRERSALISGRKLVPLPPSPLPDMLYGLIDGTGVPMTARETAGREGKGEDGRARTREAKLAVFFTQDGLDDDGYPVRDRDSSSYIATFEPVAVFADLVKAEGIRRGADHVRQLTIIGDGAPWIWNIASSKFPGATQIVDLFHARQHLHDLARQLEFMLLDRKDEWLAARLGDLDHGDIDGIRRAARVFPLEGIKKDELDTALGYFENNAPRMRYHWFRQCGLFVGSGVVEAGCKSVIGQRLKQAGMHWTKDGAGAIMTLRCQQASRPEDRIWHAPHNQTPAA